MSASLPAPPPASGKLVAWGRLLRLSLAPSAAADVLAGVVLGHGGSPPLSRGEPWLLVLSSLAVYHGAMALNDWSDREHDARTRPDRPLPSGAVRPEAAFAAALGLTLVGGVAAALAAPLLGAWMLAVAAVAWLYDLAGRGPWSGPLLLALCRAANLGVGLLLPGVLDARSSVSLFAWLAPIAYGAYVFVISRLGRLEDGEDRAIGTRPRGLLLAAALLLLAPAGLPVAAPWTGRLAALALGAAGAAGLARRALTVARFDRGAVGAAMGLALRRLLVFSAAVAVLPGTQTALLIGAGILAGYPVAHALRRVFPPS